MTSVSLPAAGTSIIRTSVVSGGRGRSRSGGRGGTGLLGVIIRLVGGRGGARGRVIVVNNVRGSGRVLRRVAGGGGVRVVQVTLKIW